MEFHFWQKNERQTSQKRYHWNWNKPKFDTIIRLMLIFYENFPQQKALKNYFRVRSKSWIQHFIRFGIHQLHFSAIQFFPFFWFSWKTLKRIWFHFTFFPWTTWWKFIDITLVHFTLIDMRNYSFFFFFWLFKYLQNSFVLWSMQFSCYYTSDIPDFMLLGKTPEWCYEANEGGNTRRDQYQRVWKSYWTR